MHYFEIHYPIRYGKARPFFLDFLESLVFRLESHWPLMGDTIEDKNSNNTVLI